MNAPSIGSAVRPLTTMPESVTSPSKSEIGMRLASLTLMVSSNEIPMFVTVSGRKVVFEI